MKKITNGGTFIMKQCPNFKLYNQQSFDELYMFETLISVFKKSCESREFGGQYYGISSKEGAKLLSAERNEYLNILTLLSDRVANLKKINLNLENDICLQKNANNCRRQVATERSAY